MRVHDFLQWSRLKLSCAFSFLRNGSFLFSALRSWGTVGFGTTKLLGKGLTKVPSRSDFSSSPTFCGGPACARTGINFSDDGAGSFFVVRKARVAASMSL